MYHGVFPRFQWEDVAGGRTPEEYVKNRFLSFRMEELVSWLENICFFSAPASTKYHGNYQGGLVEHSLNVALNLESLTENLALEWENDRSPFLVGVLHDVCKADQYRALGDGTYEYRKDGIYDHHAEKSLAMLTSSPIRLTQEEAVCIRWHMGAFTEEDEWKYYGNAIEQYPNVLWTHTADMIASRIQKI